ncbi:hypothetical protein TSUD_245250 [Trifolium subterraneum]|uniref:Endonuclease/exonuclease/phosphatase domain-containing protein n=1 Tax=Trifolium subterraneum TaxID=3900 RepID=A0A2Z6P353_TRISU|nr:hypothetical protein TSUD_245250 [Trifolium subterraneum]
MVVDTMVEKMADGLEEEEDTRFQANMKVINSRADNEVRSVEEDLVNPKPPGEAVITCPDLVLNHPVASANYVSGIRNSPLVSGDQGSISICSPTVGLRSPVGEKWQETERRSKVSPVTNQSKEVSRQVSSDEAASSASVNNDLKHWVVMQGNAKVAEDDVREVGKVIGVTFNGDNENMFSVLARAGLVGTEKRQEVRKLVGNQNPSLLCIQETKLQSCDSTVCSSLWVTSPHAFSYRPSIGASGGLLTLWDCFEVDVWASESQEFVLWCHSRFIKAGKEFSVANVYAPCDLGAKQQLWDSLSVRIQALGRTRVCFCGDFNAVRSIEERRLGRGRPQPLDHLSFNSFIEDNNLIDLLLSGYCTHVARMRGLSYHFPLILAANEEEWGPRPSRMLKCWKDFPGYNIFVKDKWNSYQVDGWGGFVLKEKFKMIKMTLKD